MQTPDIPLPKLAPTVGMCQERLDLSTRVWECPSCRTFHKRDENAARNLQIVGTSTIGLGSVRQVLPASTV